MFQVSGTPTPFLLSKNCKNSAASCSICQEINCRPSSVTDMFDELKWSSLSTRRAVNRLSMVHRIMNDHSAINANTFFDLNKNTDEEKT